MCFGSTAQSYDFSVTQAAIDNLSSGTTAPNGDFCPDGWGSMSADVSNAAFACPDGSDNNTSLGMGINLVSVSIDILHTWNSDLDIKLIAPSGTELILASGVGGSGDNFTGTVFMDGNDPINTGFPPFTGTYAPQGGTLAGSFAGEEAEGSWSIQACDGPGGDDGT
ncbi:MAG: proprotein convertase P-domain-containing protein, partial [Saprospiraceae bacterium]